MVDPPSVVCRSASSASSVLWRLQVAGALFGGIFWRWSGLGASLRWLLAASSMVPPNQMSVGRSLSHCLLRPDVLWRCSSFPCHGVVGKVDALEFGLDRVSLEGPLRKIYGKSCNFLFFVGLSIICPSLTIIKAVCPSLFKKRQEYCVTGSVATTTRNKFSVYLPGRLTRL
jgi:hypothetical protein